MLVLFELDTQSFHFEAHCGDRFWCYLCSSVPLFLPCFVGVFSLFEALESGWSYSSSSSLQTVGYQVSLLVEQQVNFEQANRLS